MSFASGFTDTDNTIYEVLSRQCELNEAICKTEYYDIIPADEKLSNVFLELEPTDTTVLKNKLDPINIY